MSGYFWTIFIRFDRIFRFLKYSPLLQGTSLSGCRRKRCILEVRENLVMGRRQANGLDCYNLGTLWLDCSSQGVVSVKGLKDQSDPTWITLIVDNRVSSIERYFP